MIFLEYVGSRASLSANNKDKTAVSQRLAAVLILYTYKTHTNCQTIPAPYKYVCIMENQKEGR